LVLLALGRGRVTWFRVGEKKMRFGGERVCDGGWCWRMRGHMGLIGWF